MTNTANTVKKLHRSTSDRMVAGVCGGWADYLGVDPSLLRIGLVAATVLGAGAPILIYAAAWVLTPEAGGDD
ncbi:PspC domain-containing protein [Amycolatopsis acidicola]|uniref:PspC domain-containing protein n=1 Tax=Amycolatopsis acidicola TaxID=2596893 RepID=A0A5N0V638_9PSEU|nr:PspC domain-containing protein [Amycolatopsis acidicola]KAA9161827.1 PspC domain-containing protein [Amycolatopsis acidicola]